MVGQMRSRMTAIVAASSRSRRERTAAPPGYAASCGARVREATRVAVRVDLEGAPRVPVTVDVEVHGKASSIESSAVMSPGANDRSRRRQRTGGAAAEPHRPFLAPVPRITPPGVRSTRTLVHTS